MTTGRINQVVTLPIQLGLHTPQGGAVDGASGLVLSLDDNVCRQSQQCAREAAALHPVSGATQR